MPVSTTGNLAWVRKASITWKPRWRCWTYATLIGTNRWYRLLEWFHKRKTKTAATPWMALCFNKKTIMYKPLPSPASTTTSSAQCGRGYPRWQNGHGIACVVVVLNGDPASCVQEPYRIVKFHETSPAVAGGGHPKKMDSRDGGRCCVTCAQALGQLKARHKQRSPRRQKNKGSPANRSRITPEGYQPTHAIDMNSPDWNGLPQKRKMSQTC